LQYDIDGNKVLTPDEIRIALENVSGRALEDDKLLAVLQEVDKVRQAV